MFSYREEVFYVPITITVVFCKWVLIVFQSSIYENILQPQWPVSVNQRHVFNLTHTSQQRCSLISFSRAQSHQGKFDQHQASRIQISSKSPLFHIVPRQYVTCEWSGTCNCKASTLVQLHSSILLRYSLSKFALAFHHIYINKGRTD